ncbi:MAG: pyrroline-5-carboxylate reductase [Rhodospirillaceae bacterium]|nr:pyrroline-5-carboxylate reductase [Rhodospirillaceae bacterium]MBT3780101.1 pyrroline-5-carboxylate reductase [Rhodospirillaceae bacterium]MBT3975488.1 pyrroline-5-carboxylate reductase [Rhodospirillaceae bacterium]MBT4167999.1 pyrroline-5-carboxylate reductase [Rhodospirillaceae bacterium]MBT4566203.1 pyrroline-5-carboxylate reductase [Rhodospirillaceae bacterium]
MSALSGPVLLVGCGKMGGALLGGWLDQGIAADQVVVVEPALDADRSAVPPGVTVLADAAGIAADFTPAVVIFAVKPQVMGDVVPSYGRFVAGGAVFLSIAAGTLISFFEANLGDGAAVVRVMPNTPAAVRRGMSVLCANSHASAAQQELCGGLMAAVGDTAWLDDESLMDAVTAVSGSGPAYVFYLIECLAQAGVEVGLDPELSARLALQTVAGSGELARLSDDDAAQLRINVTSPGGTTQAALQVLMADGGLQPLMTTAVEAAEKRGKELGA